MSSNILPQRYIGFGYEEKKQKGTIVRKNKQQKCRHLSWIDSLTFGMIIKFSVYLCQYFLNSYNFYKYKSVAYHRMYMNCHPGYLHKDFQFIYILNAFLLHYSYLHINMNLVKVVFELSFLERCR